jgi:menaquinone-dependent protoporphyrinogen IX oxidase
MHDRILVLYPAGQGDTPRIARRIAALLAASGHTPTLVDVGAPALHRRPADFDGVIVCAPDLGGRHPRAVRRFVQAHRAALDAIPCAFASVCPSACREAPGCSDAWQHLHELVRETGWHPWLAETLAGAVASDPDEGHGIRWWIRRRTTAAQPTPTAPEEPTDWPRVDRFVERFAAMLDRAATTAAPVAMAR